MTCLTILLMEVLQLVMMFEEVFSHESIEDIKGMTAKNIDIVGLYF